LALQSEGTTTFDGQARTLGAKQRSEDGEMRLETIESTRAAGFDWFLSIRELTESGCAGVPELPGIYLILRGSPGAPTFLDRSRGGWFKGKDPAVPVVRLQEEWVDGAVALYIGQAGGGSSRATLRKRLSTYMRFGSGAAVGHWGGRLIWQLEDANELLVAWKPTESSDPREIETALIREFASAHGSRPFANLRD
jgi:hypothetical protein